MLEIFCSHSFFNLLNRRVKIFEDFDDEVAECRSNLLKSSKLSQLVATKMNKPMVCHVCSVFVDVFLLIPDQFLISIVKIRGSWVSKTVPSTQSHSCERL